MSFDLGTLTDLFESDKQTRSAVDHNISILKCIRGGQRMAQQNFIHFDPREEYWRLPERRFAVAYLADRWTARFAPASSVRTLAVAVLRHFDRARTDGVFTERGVLWEQMGGIEAVCERLAQHALRMSPLPEWESLRQYWPKRLATPGEDIAEFLRQFPGKKNSEHGFSQRLPWFPYLGAGDTSDLERRRAFFFGYANLWTTTNAYVRAGAQAFASVLQNTKSEAMLAYVNQWLNGETPAETGFLTFGRDDLDAEPQDRSQYAAVIEVYGFLSLQRVPFYNNRAEVYRRWFDLPGSLNAYELTSQIGKRTSEWLSQRPQAAEHLTSQYRQMLSAPISTRVELEGVDSVKVAKIAQSDGPRQSQLLAELDRSASEVLRGLNDQQAAMIALHLLLDARVYLETESRVQPEVTAPSPGVPEASTHYAVGDPSPVSDALRLPQALRPHGERALAYLRAGLHVLFAGAPGTGKTTLAQIVGYAWNNQSSTLPDSIPMDQAPLTTVGNSAWSPFHTIGGLVPNESSKLIPHGGIFIDPASVAGPVWSLRPGAIVLDEMNRADLDRCIGELYPLLSGSVRSVAPAGLIGVRQIRANDRFRVIATINDANLDDIVFPISEGLARRFQRIDLLGGSRDDVLDYLSVEQPDAAQASREKLAREAVGLFFEIARDLDLLAKDEEDDRLPFGVAYFTLLRAWVHGTLEAPVLDSTPREQAIDLMASSLRTLSRQGKWNHALAQFLSKA